MIQFGIAMTGSFAAAVLRAAAAAGRAASHGLFGRSRRRRCDCCRTSSDWGTFADGASSSRSRCSGGPSGIRAPSRAAAATSRSACWRRRSEKDAVGGTLLFNAAHYALRPWPWIIVALASMLVFPTLDDIGRALPHVDRALIGHDMAYPAMLHVPAAGRAGADDRGPAGGVRLDHLDAPQLGHQLPRPRPLSAISASQARPSGTT